VTPESLNPISRPLLVDVADAALMRYRRREQNERSQPAQIGHQARSAGFREVVSDFEIDRQIKGPVHSIAAERSWGTKVLSDRDCTAFTHPNGAARTPRGQELAWMYERGEA
jgi:hypothetical protein